MQIIKKTFLNKNKKNDFLGLTFSAVLVYCSQQAGEGPHNTKKVMRNLNKWKEFFNEVAAACNYWELGFGDINPEMEMEVVRECFVEGWTAAHTCDAWREAVVEEMHDAL